MELQQIGGSGAPLTGYLITKLVMVERGEGRFTFLRFYERRAGRLFPALFATVVVALPLSLFWLSSRDAQDAMVPAANAQVQFDPIEFSNRLAPIMEAGCGRSRTSCSCGSFSESGPNIPIIGDSLAPDMLTALQSGWPESNIRLLWHGGCGPVPSNDRRAEDCDGVFAERLDLIREFSEQANAIVLIFRPHPAHRLDDLVTSLAAAGQVSSRMILIGGGLRYERPTDVLFERLSSSAMPRPSLERFQGESFFQRVDDLREIAERFGARFVERRTFFCHGEECRDYTADQAHLLNQDLVHMTLEGAQELGTWLRRTYPDLLDPA